MQTQGGALKRKDKLSGRYADVLSQLYLASATLKRYLDEHAPEADLPLVRWACEDAVEQAQEALAGIIANFPQRFVAWWLRVLSFPFGKSFAPPSDRLGHEAASILLAPSAARDRLTAGMFVPEDPEQALGLS